MGGCEQPRLSHLLSEEFIFFVFGDSARARSLCVTLPTVPGIIVPKDPASREVLLECGGMDLFVLVMSKWVPISVARTSALFFVVVERALSVSLSYINIFFTNIPFVTWTFPARWIYRRSGVID